MIESIKPIFLWTDYCIFIVLLGCLYLLYYLKKNDHIKYFYPHLLYKPLRLSALMLLTVYITIGLLDSLHFQMILPTTADQPVYPTPYQSILDVLLKPLPAQIETTYSKPFATHAFMREQQLEDGATIEWYYPELDHAGQHLTAGNLTAHEDIMNRLLTVSWQWSAIIIGNTGLALLWLYVKNKVSPKTVIVLLFDKKTAFPWKTFCLTLSLILLCGLIFKHFAGFYHILGTDKVGRDVLYSSLKSIRTGLVIGTVTTLISLPFAVLLGGIAGYFRGWVDDVIQYLYIVLSSIPSVLLIAAAILSVQVYLAQHQTSMATYSDLRLLLLCTVLGLTSWTSLCRLIRAETLKLRAMEFIDAARTLSVRPLNILIKHIVPNLVHIILIAIILDFSSLVLAEAVLSYVGVGVDPTTYSWGNMINGARTEMSQEPVIWWSLFGSFLFMFILVLSANIVSDGVRDVFDPKSHP